MKTYRDYLYYISKTLLKTIEWGCLATFILGGTVFLSVFFLEFEPNKVFKVFFGLSIVFGWLAVPLATLVFVFETVMWFVGKAPYYWKSLSPLNFAFVLLVVALFRYNKYMGFLVPMLIVGCSLISAWLIVSYKVYERKYFVLVVTPSFCDIFGYYAPLFFGGLLLFVSILLITRKRRKGVGVERKGSQELTLLVFMLLVFGSWVWSIKGGDGSTPLHDAASRGQTEIALTLIEAEADIEARNKDDYTPLHRAASSGYPETALALIEAGADINARGEYDSTPLHRAAWMGHTETALALIKAGADVKARNKNGNTPLHLAAWLGYTEIALALIKAGADVNARNKDDNTPLHRAAKKGHTETALALIEAGADVNARNEDDNTPAQVARSRDYPETASAIEATR